MDNKFVVCSEAEYCINKGFIDVNDDVQFKTIRDVSDLFKRLKKKTGIDVHAHLLRHTHATIYYQTTKDIKQVQERLGHSQIQTTMNMYLHPSDEDIRANWEIAQPSFKITKGGSNDN